jgi:hypothetical protein
MENKGHMHPVGRAVMASARLGKWMSAALDDPNVCEEMKADIRAWFSAGEPVQYLWEALEPFAKMGKIIDGPFGVPTIGDDAPFKSGAAWQEGGETRTLTYGDFRRACAALSRATEGGA